MASCSASSSRLPPGCCNGKIPEMDSVVASVSGYVGAERFNLIKLINGSGGYFVGRLIRTATHLVCWTFQGDKYDTAKRMGVIIVNHRWFEDCVKARRRLPESPYTVLCGKAVGPLQFKELQPMAGKLDRERAKLQKTSSLRIGQEPNTEGKFQNDVQIYSENGIESNHLEITSEFHSPSSNTNLQIKTSLCFDIIPKERDKGKRISSVCKAGSKCKIPVTSTKPSSSRMNYDGQKKRKCSIKFSCSILDYVSSSDAINLEDDASSSQKSIEGIVGTKLFTDTPGPAGALFTRDRVETAVPEEIEDGTLVAPLRLKRVRSRKQLRLSFAKCNSVNDRAQQRLIEKTIDQTCISSSNERELENDKCFAQSAAEEALETRDNCKQELNSAKVLHCTDMCDKAETGPKGSPIAIACVICHTEKISSAEGVLTCGHHFCFLCIKKWASEAVSKAPTCPLCKAPFDIITKRERKARMDNFEACSQSSPSQYDETLVMLGFTGSCHSDQLQPASTSLSCVMCGNRDTEELLLTCSGCGCRCAHTFCLDPPLPPIPDTNWLCGRCTQRRRVDTTWWYQLHHFERRLD